MTIKKIKDYITGHFRYFLYYNKYLNRLMPLHIYEQISYRLFVMDPDCLAFGYCKLCGCTTPQKQMANGRCPKPCYPVMMSSKAWEFYKRAQKVSFTYHDPKRPREFELRIEYKII